MTNNGVLSGVSAQNASLYMKRNERSRCRALQRLATWKTEDVDIATGKECGIEEVGN